MNHGEKKSVTTFNAALCIYPRYNLSVDDFIALLKSQPTSKEIWHLIVTNIVNFTDRKTLQNYRNRYYRTFKYNIDNIKNKLKVKLCEEEWLFHR